MALINPYLNFNGNTEEAFMFYKAAFGGEFAMLKRFNEMPFNNAQPLSKEDGNKIMHIALPIKGNILMGTDMLESMGQKMQNGNRYSISISAESREEADQLFNSLSAGGQIEMPIADSPWGSYFGMFKDKFDIQWLVDFDANFNSKL
jgi:PhnB protein